MKKTYKKNDGKRRDHEGRVLCKGESQRFDLSYQYRYTDKLGRRQYVYSKDLNELRRKVELIERQKLLGVDYAGGSITVEELVSRYLKMMSGKRVSTMETYDFVPGSLQNEGFGRNCIRDVKCRTASSGASTWRKMSTSSVLSS